MRPSIKINEYALKNSNQYAFRNSNQYSLKNSNEYALRNNNQYALRNNNEYELRNNPQSNTKISNSNQKPFYYYNHFQKSINFDYRNSSSIQDLRENENGSIGIKKDKKQIKQIKSRIQSILKRNNQNMSPLLQTYYPSDIKTLGLIDKSHQSKTIQVRQNQLQTSLLFNLQNSSSITSIKDVSSQDKGFGRQNSCRAKLSKFYFRKNNPIKINRQYLLYNNIMIQNKSKQKLRNKKGTLSLPTNKYFKLQNYNQFRNKDYINLSSKKTIEKRNKDNTLNNTKTFHETKNNIFQVQTFRQTNRKSLEIFKKILQKNINSNSKKLINNKSSRLLYQNLNVRNQYRQNLFEQGNQDKSEFALQQNQDQNENISINFQGYNGYNNQNYYKTHKLNVKDQQLNTYYQKFYKNKQSSNNYQIEKKTQIINKFRKVSQNYSFQKHQLEKQISRLQNQKNNEKKHKDFQKTGQFFTCAGSSTLYPSILKPKIDFTESFKHKKIGYLAQSYQKSKNELIQENERRTNERMVNQKKSRRKLLSLKQPLNEDYESFDPWERTKLYQEEMATIQIQQKS